MASWTNLDAWKIIIIITIIMIISGPLFRVLISEVYTIVFRTAIPGFQNFQTSIYPLCDHSWSWVWIYPAPVVVPLVRSLWGP